MDAGSAIQIGLTVLGALGGGYLGVRLSVVRLEGRVSALEEKVTRLNVWHDSHGAALPTRIGVLEANLQGLRDWKHEKVDPYLPSEVDAHERRITELERQGRGR